MLGRCPLNPEIMCSLTSYKSCYLGTSLLICESQLFPSLFCDFFSSVLSLFFVKVSQRNIEMKMDMLEWGFLSKST